MAGEGATGEKINLPNTCPGLVRAYLNGTGP